MYWVCGEIAGCELMWDYSWELLGSSQVRGALQTALGPPGQSWHLLKPAHVLLKVSQELLVMSQVLLAKSQELLRMSQERSCALPKARFVNFPGASFVLILA